MGGLDQAGRRPGVPEGQPGDKIKIVSYDGDANGSNSFRTKMELFNRAGSGWPDVVFFSFVGNWNNFFLPYVMLPGSGQYPMPVGLTQMLASTPTFNPVVGGSVALQPQRHERDC